MNRDRGWGINVNPFANFLSSMLTLRYQNGLGTSEIQAAVSFYGHRSRSPCFSLLFAVMVVGT